jgi:hypothetical protein
MLTRAAPSQMNIMYCHHDKQEKHTFLPLIVKLKSLLFPTMNPSTSRSKYLMVSLEPSISQEEMQGTMLLTLACRSWTKGWKENQMWNGGEGENRNSYSFEHVPLSFLTFYSVHFLFVSTSIASLSIALTCTQTLVTRPRNKLSKN